MDAVCVTARHHMAQGRVAIFYRRYPAENGKPIGSRSRQVNGLKKNKGIQHLLPERFPFDLQHGWQPGSLFHVPTAAEPPRGYVYFFTST